MYIGSTQMQNQALPRGAGAVNLPGLRIYKLIHVHRLRDLRGAERQEYFPATLYGHSTAETHTKARFPASSLQCRPARRPFRKMGALLRGVASNVDPRIARVPFFHTACCLDVAYFRARRRVSRIFMP